MAETLFPANQIAWREECSDGLYHILVMRLNPGDMALSKTPRRTRRVMSPAKLDARGCKSRTTDHITLYSSELEFEAKSEISHE
jgi:hypothetical protein